MIMFTQVRCLDRLNYLFEHKEYEYVIAVIECNNDTTESVQVIDGMDMKNFEFPKGAYKLHYEKRNVQNSDSMKYEMDFYIGNIVPEESNESTKVIIDNEGKVHKVPTSSEPIIVPLKKVKFKN